VRANLDLLQERGSRDALQGPPEGNDEPGGNPGPGNGPPRHPDAGSPGPSLAALVNITVPLSTLLGQSGTPGEVAGFGLLDAGTARDLIAAAARNPHTRWCVTALHPDGTAAARGSCDHQHTETGYQPSRTLQHLIHARSTRCSAPRCGRPAARCDLDHTTAWDKGGPTCECNLAPLRMR
jgi:hypothetical protein